MNRSAPGFQRHHQIGDRVLVYHFYGGAWNKKPKSVLLKGVIEQKVSGEYWIRVSFDGDSFIVACYDGEIIKNITVDKEKLCDLKQKLQVNMKSI